ncbi:MAG: DNA polymerase III subunit delta' [candidate division NC10 bacterium]|nr:DNA polymerase III subunit delta' [candidate division NC10 bacterium]
MPFGEICGQDRAVLLLRRAWAGGRLAQAYCFAGPPGAGKRTTALALAQAVNCLAPATAGPAPDACGTCRSCRRIAAGQHPDVILVTPQEKTVITIEQVRDLAARANLRAYEGNVKVWILDPADQMQEPAANAFLKTLEEPAGRSLFILVTTAFTALLATIRSRCQEVRFDPLGDEALRTILMRHGRSAEDVAAVLPLAGGNAERALGLDVVEERARQERVVAETWGALGSVPALLEQAERIGKDRATLEAALEILLGFTRDLAVFRVGESSRRLLPTDRLAAGGRAAAGIPLSATLKIHEAQAEARRRLAVNAQPRFTAERMLLKMREAMEEKVGGPA